MNRQAIKTPDDSYIVEEGPHFIPSKSRFDVDRVMQSISNFATVSEALRILGGAVLLASMSLFLLQGWDEGNDVRRYLMLLAQTGLLAMAGFAMSHGLKETKGARLFFGLALVSIPANFIILSALLYSVTQWDGALTTVPGYATWQIDSIAGTGLMFAGAMTVLLPITLFCFAIMARHSARTLSLHFFVMNVLLLVPIRNSMLSGILALVGIVYALYIARRVIGKDTALKTAEGKFAIATLFIPAGVILFRSMYFYQVDSLLIGMLTLAVYLAARQVSTFPDRSPRIALALESLSLPLALIFALATLDAFVPHLTAAWRAPLFVLAFVPLVLDVIRRTNSRRLAMFASALISIVVATSFVLNTSASSGVLAPFLALLVGGLLASFGFLSKDRFAAVFGAVTIFHGLLIGFEPLVAMIVSSSWVDLAIFGATAIAAGSLLDRHGVAIKLHLSNRIATLTERKQETALGD